MSKDEMLKEKINKIETDLVTRSIDIEFSVEEGDAEYFSLPGTKLLRGTAEIIADMVLGSLYEDSYSVDIVRFKEEDVTALIFNQGMATGRYLLIGITQGLNPSSDFVRKSLMRWTTIENFVWPEKINVISRDLLSESLISDLYAINTSS